MGEEMWAAAIDSLNNFSSYSTTTIERGINSHVQRKPIARPIGPCSPSYLVGAY